MPYRHSALGDILEAIGEQQRLYRDPVQEEFKRATKAANAFYEQTSAIRQHAIELAASNIDAQRATIAMPDIGAIRAIERDAVEAMTSYSALNTIIDRPHLAVEAQEQLLSAIYDDSTIKSLREAMPALSDRIALNSVLGVKLDQELSSYGLVGSCRELGVLGNIDIGMPAWLTARATTLDIRQAIGAGDWSHISAAVVAQAHSALSSFEHLLNTSGLGESAAWYAVHDARSAAEDYCGQESDDETDDSFETENDASVTDVASPSTDVESESLASCAFDTAVCMYKISSRFRRLACALTFEPVKPLSIDDMLRDVSPNILIVMAHFPRYAPELSVLFFRAWSIYAMDSAPLGPSVAGHERRTRMDYDTLGDAFQGMERLLDEIERSCG
jgi:hypothetical protein